MVFCQCWENYREKNTVYTITTEKKMPSAIHKTIYYINSLFIMQSSSFLNSLYTEGFTHSWEFLLSFNISSYFQNLSPNFPVHIPFPSRTIKEQGIRKQSL